MNKASERSPRFIPLTRTHAIHQVDSLCEETGCWLYIAANHVNAKLPYTWYTSRRLLVDAFEESKTFHTGMGHLLESLKGASLLKAAEYERAMIAKEEALQDLQAKHDLAIRENEVMKATITRLEGASTTVPPQDTPQLTTVLPENPLESTTVPPVA